MKLIILLILSVALFSPNAFSKSKNKNKDSYFYYTAAGIGKKLKIKRNDWNAVNYQAKNFERGVIIESKNPPRIKGTLLNTTEPNPYGNVNDAKEVARLNCKLAGIKPPKGTTFKFVKKKKASYCLIVSTFSNQIGQKYFFLKKAANKKLTRMMDTTAISFNFHEKNTKKSMEIINTFLKQNGLDK